MQKKRKSKPYQNQYLSVLMILIFVLLVYQYILHFSSDENIRAICNAVLIPVVMAVFGLGINRMDRSNADVDIKLYFGNEKVPYSLQPIWLIPNAIYKVSSMKFIEIENIGETMISAIGIVFGKQNNKKYESYKISYPIHKNERVYFAVPDNADINTVSIVYYSFGFDNAVTFSGEQIEISGIKLFSKRDIADAHIRLRENSIRMCTRGSLNQIIQISKEREENENCV